MATAHGQIVSPVPAPTIITDAPCTISAPGYYQRGANLNHSGTSGNTASNNTVANVTKKEPLASGTPALRWAT